MRLLRIDSSARANSVSRLLTSRFVEAWREENPQGEVMQRDLAETPLPYITDEWSGVYSDAAQLTPAQRRYLSTSDALIEELFATDDIVIGAPMHNYSITWLLKAWIDQVVRPGKTVLWGPAGSKGLLRGRRVAVLTARGGSYPAGTPRAAADFQEPYLRYILNFIGMDDVTFVHAEKLARRDQAELSRSAAFDQINELVARKFCCLAYEAVQ